MLVIPNFGTESFCVLQVTKKNVKLKSLFNSLSNFEKLNITHLAVKVFKDTRLKEWSHLLERLMQY